MKKFVWILITVVFLMSVAACSKDEPVEPEPITEVVQEEVIEEEIIPEIIPLLTLENEQTLAEFETNSGDTILEFDELTISIPKDAYDSEVSFKIATKDIVADQFELIEPVSSFYEIDNGNVFSKVPIGLQIPLDTNTDDFVMAFYFDEESETLEGIPSIRLENDSLLVMTHHFSNIFVGMMSEEDLEKYKSGGEITTKFTPGVDDFSFSNYGSFIAPGGHCSGQSIAAMWYFKNIRRYNLDDPNSALHGMLDNNDLFPTPKVWQDDSLLYRFASSVHKDEEENNDLIYDQMYIAEIVPGYEYDLIPDYNAKDNWDAFYTSMILTNRPQLVSVYREKEGKSLLGHALIAYKIEGNKLYVADPNDPGETRYIEYNNGNFKPYSSGTNAQEIENSGEIEFNRVYFLGEFATIDEWKIEKRWKEVVNKDMGNDYFPYPMIISDGMTSYKNSYEFNIEVSKPDFQDKLGFHVYDENFHKLNPMLNNDPTIPDPSLSFPIIAINDEKTKIIVPLKDEGYNWLGFWFVDKYDKWENFQWIKVFVDTNLQLTADKYKINPGDTAHIEASMLSGIDFPDLEWTFGQGLDWEIDDNEENILSKSKSYDFTSDELGDYLITANDPLSSLYADISITVTDDTIEEHDPIPDEDSHIAQGTYSCSFWLTSYEAVPFENFKADAFYSVEHKRQLATDNANNYNAMYAAKFGEITHDKEDFSVTVHDDGSCDISFSTFLFVNSNSKGISSAPFNGGSISWTAEEGSAEFKGNVILNLTDDGVEMKGSITKKNPEYQFMFNETKTYFFEGVKIH